MGIPFSICLRSVTHLSPNAKLPKTGACTAVTQEKCLIELPPAVSPSGAAQTCLQPAQSERGGGDYHSPAAVPYQEFDRALHAGIGRVTGGLAPSASLGGFLHWAAHLAASPGKQLELATEAVKSGVENLVFAAGCAGGNAADPCQQALPQDRRFRAPEWGH